jgi:LCP family protein required for cell wall assembly
MPSIKRWLTIFPLALVLWACSTTNAPVVTPTSVYSQPFFLVTDSLQPLASPTPTQANLPTPVSTISLETYATPLPPLLISTNTPAATDASIPTADLNVLNPTLVPPPAPVYDGPDVVTFLLIGSDKRPEASFRTDTMVVAILRPRDRQISLISIPRDLWVYIPDWEMQRINTAYQHGDLVDYPGGGPQLLKDTIEYNLGLHIDHTAMVEFDGFRQIVNTLGGIDVPIACPYTDWRLIDPSYDPENENNWVLYTTPTGVVHMDGDLALWYARSRSKSNDFDRGRRQQEVLRSIFERVLTTDTVSKIPQLYNDFNSLVATDLGLGDILKLASLAPQFTNANIRSYYIRPPIVSSWITPGGAYVLLPDQAALQNLVTQALTASPQAAVNETTIVQVENGTLNEGWDALAVSRLSYAGFATRINPADRRDYSASILIDLTPSQDPARVQTLLAVMGLPQAQVVSLPSPGSPVQYRLILGADYQVCFQPEGMTP